MFSGGGVVRAPRLEFSKDFRVHPNSRRISHLSVTDRCELLHWIRNCSRGASVGVVFLVGGVDSRATGVVFKRIKIIGNLCFPLSGPWEIIEKFHTFPWVAPRKPLGHRCFPLNAPQGNHWKNKYFSLGDPLEINDFPWVVPRKSMRNSILFLGWPLGNQLEIDDFP